MAEPEDIIAEGALRATRLVRDVWARRAGGAAIAPTRLTDVRRRLELLVAAVFPEAPEIGVADAPAPLTLLARLAHRSTVHLMSSAALASTDGLRIRLPRELEAIAPEDVLVRYQLLALEQAARAARGTPSFVPSGDLLLRDLFLLSEAGAVDRTLVGMLPGFAPALRRARAESLTRRGAIPRKASAAEQAMEQLTRDVLAADPLHPPPPLEIAETPRHSLAWAGKERGRIMRLAGPYRGTAPVMLWGTIASPLESVATTPASPESETGSVPGRTHTLPRRPRVREAAEDEDDDEPGTWIVRADDPQEKVEDPAGLMRPTDRDQDADPGELADALSELKEARLVRTPGAPKEVLASEDPLQRAAAVVGERRGNGIAYPEWDWRAAAYRPRGAIVREFVAKEGDADWVEQALGRNAALVRRIRRDFERLRPRRTALRRQPDGAELDIDAVVAAYADRRGGGVSDERYYIDTRPLRRDVAITLLVDVSASTDGWVSGDRRIIDVEKEALLVVCAALTALGDPFAVLAFSGEGPARVEVQVLAQFREGAEAGQVLRRISALEPAGYTRVGAALRHATAGLMREPVHHRLLLLLSDGRPNDVDQYEGRYGIEDARVAVLESRLQGVHCFCLTVDREAPRYATRIFGRSHFTVLPRVERLPTVLASLLRDLVR